MQDGTWLIVALPVPPGAATAATLVEDPSAAAPTEVLALWLAPLCRDGELALVRLPGDPIDARTDHAWIRVADGDLGPSPVPALGRGGTPTELPPVRAGSATAVLVASKNGAGSIGDTVRSAVGQADVYVVSDGSTDDTADVARAAGAVVLDLETNVGKPAALQCAVRHFGLTARYDTLAILDDDTVIEGDFLVRASRAMKEGTAIVVGKTATRWTDERKWNLWLGARAYAYWRYQATVRRGQSALNVMSCISGSNSLYRTELLDQVLVPDTPYIVDDTYWTLETHRRNLGRIVYEPGAVAWICDPTNLRDWYKQNLRWLWGTFQGVWGHRIGRRASVFDLTYVLMILDWVLFVVGLPLLLGFLVWSGWIDPVTFLGIHVAGYAAGVAIGAAVLGKWRLLVMVPGLIAADWIYRTVMVHALFKTFRQPRVESCRWDSPVRY